MSSPNAQQDGEEKLKIYFLPNLMTAGNLVCGFVALTKIVEAEVGSATFTSDIKQSIMFILIGCVFDLLDGRVARMGGKESPFGQEFDSLADIVSFGIAPAFLMHRVVLADIKFPSPEIGWVIAMVYLVCGALRLARFNCLATMGISSGKNFKGFPIPPAAGMVCSLTLLLLWCEEKGIAAREWRYVLPFMMIFLSFMMISSVEYPSFKSLDLRAKRPFPKLVAAILIFGLMIVMREYILPIVLPILFTVYLIYGFVRTRISRKMREEIEEEEDWG